VSKLNKKIIIIREIYENEIILKKEQFSKIINSFSKNKIKILNYNFHEEDIKNFIEKYSYIGSLHRGETALLLYCSRKRKENVTAIIDENVAQEIATHIGINFITSEDLLIWLYKNKYIKRTDIDIIVQLAKDFRVNIFPTLSKDVNL